MKMKLREMFGSFKRGAHQVDEMPHWDFGVPPAEDVVDFCIEKYPIPQAEKNKLMRAFGTTGFVGHELEGRQRWLHFSTKGRRRAKPDELASLPHLPDDWEGYVKRYGSAAPDSKEMRAEATDDKGRPLRTPDPFAPPVKNKAATSTLGGISTAVPPKGPAPAGAMANPAGYKQRVPTPPAAGRGQQGAKPNEPWLKGATSGMPQYPGTFKGHTVTQNGQLQSKGVGWKDKATGDHRFGKVQSMQKVGWTWDGQQWIPTDQYKGPKREHASLRAAYRFLNEANCPACGRPGAYVGMNDVECKNKNCRHHKGGGQSTDPEAKKFYELVVRQANRECNDDWLENIENGYGEGIVEKAIEGLRNSGMTPVAALDKVKEWAMTGGRSRSRGGTDDIKDFVDKLDKKR